MPNILVTNDDGISAHGLRALVQALQAVGTVTVVAPSHERSATAQSLTLRQPIFCEQVAEREWSVEGTPADAMILAFHTLLPQRPDLVVSGINRGANLGENIYYSGTVGAAMEAAINHVPAIAISVAARAREFDYKPAAEFIARLAPIVLKEGLPPGVLLNVNVPNLCTGAVRFTRQSPKITRNVLERGRGSARTNLLLAARAETFGRHRPGHGLRGDPRWRDFRHAAGTRPHAYGVTEPSLALDAAPRKKIAAPFIIIYAPARAPFCFVRRAHKAALLAISIAVHAIARAPSSTALSASGVMQCAVNSG